MRRVVLPVVGLGCFLAVLLAVYRPVLFDDRQFAWDNASYFYYPLYLRVQQEWDAGRWPLWDPGQNGGEPMLGNPVTAVLYPGKLLYALATYAWGARLYVIAHTAIAFFGLLALARSCGVSWVGSFLGGLSYAFGAPVLFLYCNVIFLVGAAWIPWGLCAIDRLLRGPGPGGAAGLAAVLALQVLGGDPESAYLTAVCGAGYAVVLAAGARANLNNLFTWQKVVLAVALWIAATLVINSAPTVRPRVLAASGVVLVAWVLVGIGMTWWWYQRPGESRLAPLFARLAGASALAAALAAVQILPTMEFARGSWRASGMSDAAYNYSLHPCRIAELIWPGVFGTSSLENRSWLQAIPPVGGHHLWAASLYMGGLTLALALCAFGWKSGTPWRTWLTTVAAIALLASLGKYGGPLWWARSGPLTAALGSHDPGFGQPRTDHFLGDGAGSPYGLLAMLLPGFGSFRYPSKLLPFAAVGLAALGGAGWDCLTDGAENRRLRRLGLAGLGASLVGLAMSWAVRASAIAFLAARVPTEATFGPVDITGAWAETQRALTHGAVVSAAVLALARWAPRWPRAAGALAVLLVAVDLTVANARLIWTVPQTEFDVPAEAARQIEATERSDPSPGPFRIHRMTGAYPSDFSTAASADRFRGMIAWARGTLCPLHALPLGLEYCATTGPLGLDDYAAFFRPRMMPIPAETARTLGVPSGQPVMYHPRRSFDIWGVRYFLLPAVPVWDSLGRGYASFLKDTDLVYPAPGVLYDRQSRPGQALWAMRQDWQLRRNRASYPRAWVVHYARIQPPATDVDERARMMGTLVFMNDPIWTDNNRPIFDLEQAALIETDDRAALRGFISRTPVGPSESVSVVKYEPQRVELRAVLARPGLVVLADTYYPGWRLTIDGKSAPIFRANRMMRGSAVPAGAHTLVYTYEPSSFRIGTILSGVAGIVLLALTWSAWLRG
jgi:hypothetical protein